MSSMVASVYPFKIFFLFSLLTCTTFMRQLAAILFADMAGYTALMQQNEQLARLKRKRVKDVLENAIEQFNGKLLQYYGDGSLSIFNSAIDSVRFAINMQQQLQQEPKVQ